MGNICNLRNLKNKDIDLNSEIEFLEDKMIKEMDEKTYQELIIRISESI